jgi:hypothetical protein
MKLYLWLAALVLCGGAVALAVSLAAPRQGDVTAAAVVAPAAVEIFPKAKNQ